MHTSWIDLWVTKRVVLLVSAVFMFVPFLLQYQGISRCDLSGCTGYAADVLITFFYPSVAVFVFTFLTYFLRNDLFKTWVRFALVWTLLSIVWVAFIPHHPSGSLGIDEKPFLALSLSILFSLFSPIIIIWKYFAMRRKA